MDEITIDLNQFKKLPTSQQRAVLFRNTEQIKLMVSNFRFHQKVQYTAITLLFILIGGKIYLGGII